MASPRTFYIRPANPGMGLRDPRTRQLIPDEGAVVEITAHWERLRTNGDILVTEQPIVTRERELVTPGADPKPGEQAPSTTRAIGTELEGGAEGEGAAKPTASGAETKSTSSTRTKGK